MEAALSSEVSRVRELQHELHTSAARHEAALQTAQQAQVGLEAQLLAEQTKVALRSAEARTAEERAHRLEARTEYLQAALEAEAERRAEVGIRSRST